jgi:hypothetical protein
MTGNSETILRTVPYHDLNGCRIGREGARMTATTKSKLVFKPSKGRGR